MNVRVLSLISLIAFALLSLQFFTTNELKETLRVGIVLPLQHAALDDIVSGFQEELRVALDEYDLDIEVENAEGDLNLERSMISRFLSEKVDLLVPISTSTTKTATGLSSQGQPILFLASDIRAGSSALKKRPDLMGVIDDIPMEVHAKFIKDVLGEIKKITLVYSASDKMIADAKLFEEAARQHNFSVQSLMIPNLSQLETISKKIAPDSEGIFILKDNLVVSGINALLKEASDMHLPVISSDEATVREGVSFAIGVSEAEVGRQGARIAARFLRGEEIRESERIEDAEKIYIFSNKRACIEQGISKEAFKKAAKKSGLLVVKS